ncbi:MAG TPA: hypothetical protein VM283_01870 [Armatimonadota bacterium]|nr:hypothetical protein [Armatimonadota bacterium]
MKAIGEWWRRRPFLATWLALAVGMVIILLAALRGKGLTAAQVAWTVAGAVALAAACAALILQGED